VKIPPRVDTAAEQITRWVNRHRWLSASLAVAAAALVLLVWLPTVAAFLVGGCVGGLLVWGFGDDRRLLLASQHDADQLLIGRLRGEIAQLRSAPRTEAATKAIAYITDPKETR
jgi:hypothetical protein